MFFCIVLLFLDDFALLNGPSHNVEMLSSVPKYKKVMICLVEKVYVLGKLQSDMSYSDVGHEFNINESTTYIKLSVSKEKHLEQGYVLIGWQKCCEQRPAGPNHLFPLGVVVQYLLIQYLW